MNRWLCKNMRQGPLEAFMKTDLWTRLAMWAGITVLALLFASACAVNDDPLKVGELRDTTPTLTSVSDSPASAEDSTGATPEPQETAVRQSAAGAAGPSSDELIKIATWGDNRIKLANWLAGYMVAHGLDRPVRMVETPELDYLTPLLINDVDVVLGAAEVWAREQAAAGRVLILGSVGFRSSNTVIAVHPSLERRAPDVIEFLKGYRPDIAIIEEQAAKIRGGRIAITENVVGLTMLKNMPEMWTPWLSPDHADAVQVEVVAGTIGLCRAWETRLGDAFQVRYCKDDPSITGGR
jgi:hypothetical protein